MTAPLEAFGGPALFVDTMVFHIFLRTKDSLVESVFNRAQAGGLILYTSVLTFDELAYRLLLARIGDLYPGSPLDHLHDNGRQLTAQQFPEIAQLRLFPNLFLIDVTPTDVMAMNQNVLSYHIRPRDALHLAAMQKVGCLHLWSEDGDEDDPAYAEIAWSGDVLMHVLEEFEARMKQTLPVSLGRTSAYPRVPEPAGVVEGGQKPVIRLIPVSNGEKPRVANLHAGMGWMSEDFDDELQGFQR